ncbi:MAG: DNA polymerase IV [Acidobacteria bacterium]|nr:MAG: DNA polymerase IV [Acidobacteriota bacterium]
MRNPERRILHCDMDCFFAAVHMRDDPGLRGKPVVVGGDPSGRGVVAAASYEARAFGIHSAMPSAQARRLCPQLIFLRSAFGRYRAESEEIFDIYREFTPLIQTLSLDEAYLDVSEHLGPYGSATAVAEAIRRRVREERGLTVSIGVAPNKLVAKIASDQDKPDGLTVVRPRQVAAFLGPLPVRRIHGVGPASAQKLGEMGITTVAELAATPLDVLLFRFGHWGRTLWQYANGRDDRAVKTDRQRKSIGTERTFPHDVRDIEQMDQILRTMTTEIVGGLEKRKIAACTITVKVRYPDFTTLTRSHSFDGPTTSVERIENCAKDLLRRTEAAERSVRLLGLSADGLVPAHLEQLTLFDRTQEIDIHVARVAEPVAEYGGGSVTSRTMQNDDAGALND